MNTGDEQKIAILANAISCRLRLSKYTESAFASLVYRQRKSLTSINDYFPIRTEKKNGKR